MFAYLVFGITYAFAASVQPGPFQAYIISQALNKGWRPALPAAFAPLVSDAPIIILVLLFLSYVSERFIHLLQIGGGVFLLFMAYSTYKTWQSFNGNMSVKPQSDKKTLLKAAIVNFLSPGPYLGWSLVMGPLLLEGWRTSHSSGIVLIVSFYLTMILCLVAIIVLFSSARKLGSRVTRIAASISVVGLVFLAFICCGLGLVTLLRIDRLSCFSYCAFWSIY